MTADPDLRAIAEALNRIDQYASLGRVSIARGRAVTAELARFRLDDTPFQRGRILSRLIRDEVRREFEQRDVDAVGPDIAEWTILYLRVQEGLSLQHIADRLQMPLRSVARYYARAKEILLDRLYTLNDTQLSTGIYCPLCGTPSATTREDHPTACECDGCGATLAIESDRDSTVHVAARL